MPTTEKLSERSTRAWNETMAALLEERERAAALRKLEKIRPLAELAAIFLAQHGDERAQARITVGTASEYEPAETFKLFLEVNGLPVYEEVLR